MMNGQIHEDHGQIQEDRGKNIWFDGADSASTTGDDDAAWWEVGIGSIDILIHSSKLTWQWKTWHLKKHAYPLQVI